MGQDFDIDFRLLPPRLQMQLWVLALDANTSKVNLAYRSGTFRTGLGYSYGGNIEASMAVRRFTTTVGVDPTNGDLDLGMAFRGFNFGASASVRDESFSASLGYGEALLPFPHELAGTFNSGAHGLQTMASSIQAAPNNPLAWYDMHSNDVAAIGDAVKAGMAINRLRQSPTGFGAGIRLNYTPQTGFVIYGGAQLRF